MTRMINLVGVLLLVLLDVLVVTPWLQAAFPADPGTERAFWSLAIPLITSAIGAISGMKKKSGVDPSSGESFGGGGGFDWGAAAPYLAGGAGLLGGMLLNKKKQEPTGSQGALDKMLAFQNERMMAAEPLNQSLLAMASSMMPTHTKVPGSAIDQWMTRHEAANRAADPQGALRTAAYPTQRSFQPNTQMTTRVRPDEAQGYSGTPYPQY